MTTWILLFIWQAVRESDEKRHSFLISIENIGNGAAKNVQVEWVFDFEKAIRIVKKLKDYSFSNYDGGFKATLPGKEKFIHFHYDLFEKLLEYDFVLPRKDEVFTKACSIPPEILELHVIYILLKYELYVGNVARSFSEDFEDFPPIKAKAKYYDIGGKKHTKNFNVKLSSSINSWTEMAIQTNTNNLRFKMYPEFIAEK